MSNENLHLPTCIICFGVLKDPIIDSCGHTFCDYCLLAWLKKNTICPMTKSSMQSTSCKNISLRNLLTNNQSKCKFLENGCNWSGNIKHLNKYHLEKCIFRNGDHDIILKIIKAKIEKVVNIEYLTMNDGIQFEGLLDANKEIYTLWWMVPKA
jgi:hypothetical protein